MPILSEPNRLVGIVGPGILCGEFIATGFGHRVGKLAWPSAYYFRSNIIERIRVDDNCPRFLPIQTPLPVLRTTPASQAKRTTVATGNAKQEKATEVSHTVLSLGCVALNAHSVNNHVNRRNGRLSQEKCQPNFRSNASSSTTLANRRPSRESP